MVDAPGEVADQVDVGLEAEDGLGGGGFEGALLEEAGVEAVLEVVGVAEGGAAFGPGGGGHRISWGNGKVIPSQYTRWKRKGDPGNFQ